MANSSVSFVDTEEASENFECLFCGLKTASKPQYIKHLKNDHSIIYDIEAVLERTRKLQQPAGTEKDTVDKGVQVDDPWLPRVLLVDVEKQKEALMKRRDELPQSDISHGSPASYRSNPQTDSSPVSWDVSERLPEAPTQPEAQPEPETTREVEYLSVTLPWFAGCEYRCKVCRHLFFYNQDLRSHIKKKHLDPDDYLDKYQSFETKAAHITCRICKEKIKRHFTSIRNHLQRRHDLSLDNYANKFSIKRDYTVVVEAPLGVEQDIRFTSGKSPKKRKCSGSDQSEPKRKCGLMFVDDEPEPRSKKWYDGCEYKCAVANCDIVFFQPQNLVTHIETAHQFSITVYQMQFGTLETKTSWLDCPICGSHIKHQKSMISHHIAIAHEEINLDNFGHIYKNAEKVPVVVDQSKVEEENRAAEMAFQGWVLGTCRFLCVACLYESKSSTEFWKHVLDEHQMSVDDYSEDFGDPCVERGTVECKSCFKPILHEPGSIEKHMNTEHSMTPRDYYDKFVLFKKSPEPVSTDAPKYKPGPMCKKKSGKGKDLLSDIRQMVMARQQPIPGRSRPTSTFARWKNACRFECQICRAFVSRWLQDLNLHLKHKHGVDQEAYSKMFSSLMTEKVNHKCKICQEEILQTVPQLTMHMFRNHGMNLEAYFNKHVLGLENGEANIVASSQSKHNRTSGNKEFFIWANQCSFGCKICGEMWIDLASCGRHVSRKHGMTKSLYHTQFGTFMTAKKYHKCLLCGKSLLHCLSVIKKHMNQVHNMEGIEYYNSIDELTANKLTATNMSQNNVAIPQSMTAPGNSSNWMDKCTFKCKLCNVEMTSNAKLRRHVMEHGFLTFDEYLAKHGSSISVINYHMCTVCNSVVTHDSEFISDHLAKEHNMRPENYVNHLTKELSQIRSKFMWNQCKIRCRLCGLWYADKRALSRHVRSKHHMAFAEYESKFGSELEEVTTKCLICNADVPFMQKSVESHLVKTHQISIFAYEQKYFAQISDQFQFLEEVRKKLVAPPPTVLPELHVAEPHVSGNDLKIEFSDETWNTFLT